MVVGLFVFVDFFNGCLILGSKLLFCVLLIFFGYGSFVSVFSVV